MKTVLVIGTGGDSRIGFLEALAKVFDRVVVFDCGVSAPSNYPDFVFHHLLPTLRIETVHKAICGLGIAPDAVTTLYEPCVVAAASVREAFALTGSTPREALLCRSKYQMHLLLHNAKLGTPETWIVNRDEKQRIADIATEQKDVVLKPDQGYGNIGVRRLRSPELSQAQLFEQIDSAFADLDKNRLADADSQSISNKWVVTKYISGVELEADLYYAHGRVCFMGVHEKTLINSRGAVIEENNAVTPPLNLSEKVVGEPKTHLRGTRT